MPWKKNDDKAWATFLREIDNNSLIKAAIENSRGRSLEPVAGFMRMEFMPDQAVYFEVMQKNIKLLEAALKKCFKRDFRIVIVRLARRDSK